MHLFYQLFKHLLLAYDGKILINFYNVLNLQYPFHSSYNRITIINNMVCVTIPVNQLNIPHLKKKVLVVVMMCRIYLTILSLFITNTNKFSIIIRLTLTVVFKVLLCVFKSTLYKVRFVDDAVLDDERTAYLSSKNDLSI